MNYEIKSISSLTTDEFWEFFEEELESNKLSVEQAEYAWNYIQEYDGIKETAIDTLIPDKFEFRKYQQMVIK